MTPLPYSALFWAAPTIILVMISIGFAVNRRFLAEVARRKLNARVFGDRASEQRAALHAMGASLHREDLAEPLVEFAHFARALKADWVLGVHVGGRLLSVALCDILGLPRERCLFVSTHLSRNRVFTMEGDGGAMPDRIEGSMLVVDDISRSGTTLRDLRNFMHLQNYNGELKLTKVVFAVLVVADKESQEHKFAPDWAYYRTLEKYFRLPWTDMSLEVATAYDRRERNSELVVRGMGHLTTDYNQVAIAEHEEQARDFARALKVAQTYLPIEKIKRKVAAEESATAQGGKT